MLKLCRENNVPDPIFAEYSGGFSVMFAFETPMGTSAHAGVTQVPLTPRQKTILTLIEENGTTSVRALMDQLNNPPSERMIRKKLNLLKKQQLVRLEGYGRSALWTMAAK